jgi:DNA-binding transcriptional regulator PaaX
MLPRTEEFLNLLLWSAEMLARPTFRNLTGSFEGWAYGKGLMRRVATLNRERLVERYPHSRKVCSYRLTTKGRLHALGGRDPEEWWGRSWDGNWRMALYDVSTRNNQQRDRMRRYLRGRGFGYLQRSAWIRPDPLEEELLVFGERDFRVHSLIFIEGRPCGGESDTEIVASAWDFAGINARYESHLKVLASWPDCPVRSHPSARALLLWAAAERAAWMNAVSNDPLLPARILPSDYLGEKAWRRRVEVLRDACRQLRSFDLPVGK